MRTTLAGASCLAILAGAVVGLDTSASADEGRERGTTQRQVAPYLSAGEAAKAVGPAVGLAAPLQMPASYPSQPELRVFPDTKDATDAADGALIAYARIAPKLNRWMRRSDRISAQVVGQSTKGRDLYLVTLTAPETEAETAQQAAWRDEIRDDPAAAAADAELRAGYKTPVWFSANIHGNEWEGTDASLAEIKDLLEDRSRATRQLLKRHRLYFSLTLNPDGRSKGTRETALTVNENRDMITSTTPESQSFVRTAQAVQAVYAADLHGYTDVLQVEPCGPPHGDNYEYDLYLPHNYAIARKIERDVVKAKIPGNTYLDLKSGEVVSHNTGNIRIPFRDTPSGWDDFPPIFTAQYAAYYGAMTSTVELPLTRNGPGDTQTRANALVNTAVGEQVIESVVDYVSRRGQAMLEDQIEVFARGVEGAPKVSLTRDNIDEVKGPHAWKALWDKADDQEPVDLPRAYVIPVGAGQRSMSDVRSLVENLLFHDIRVGTLDADTVVGGTTYPKGSYVVDLHQPLRGLANALLDLGSDISHKVPSMYDISAWSWSYLWGATVAKVGSTTDPAIGRITAVTAPTSYADAPAGGPLAFEVAGVADYQALNALLESGTPVAQLADGTAVVAATAQPEAAEVAKTYDIDFDPATPEQLAALTAPTTKPLADLTVGYAGQRVNEDMLAFAQLGFDDLRPVTVKRLAERRDLLADVDVLWVNGGLELGKGKPDERAIRRLRRWVAAGGSVVGAGPEGLQVARKVRLVAGRMVRGNPYGNGIVALDTPADSLLAPYAQPAGFVYPAYAFTRLGASVKVEQRYAADPLLAGHWRRSKQGAGPARLAGKAAAISATSPTGGKAFVFGTAPTFRTHPKGGMSQVARAFFWAGPPGALIR